MTRMPLGVSNCPGAADGGRGVGEGWGSVGGEPEGLWWGEQSDDQPPPPPDCLVSGVVSQSSEAPALGVEMNSWLKNEICSSLLLKRFKRTKKSI